MSLRDFQRWSKPRENGGRTYRRQTPQVGWTPSHLHRRLRHPLHARGVYWLRFLEKPASIVDIVGQTGVARVLQLSNLMTILDPRMFRRKLSAP